MQKTVLITGVTGLLGSNIAENLLANGYLVKGLVRPTGNLAALSDLPQLEYRYGSIMDENLDEHLSGCDYVIHAAAETRQWGVGLAQHRATNVDGTRNLLEAAQRAAIKRVVFVSTASVFQSGTKQSPGDESRLCSDNLAGTPYVTSKLEADHLVRTFSKQTDIVLVQPTFMIGARDSKPSSGTSIELFLKRKFVFFPSGGKNFVPVRDVADGIRKALEHGRSGESYLLSGHNLTFAEFYQQVKSVTGLTRTLVRIPSLLLSAAGFIGTLVEKTTQRNLPLNRESVVLLNKGSYYQSDKASSELGYSFGSVSDAVRDYLVWTGRMKNNVPK